MPHSLNEELVFATLVVSLCDLVEIVVNCCCRNLVTIPNIIFREGYLLSVFMSPPPLSWWQLLVLMMGMLWLAGAEDGAEVRSSSESLLLEPSSLLEDEELLESEELSLLLIWSMTRASAINSVHSGTGTKKEERRRNYPHV